MKKRVILIFMTMIIASVSLISATHMAITSDGENSFQVSEGSVSQYKIYITNTGAGPDSNISQVNLTIPSVLKFRTDTQVTDAFFQSFTNTTDTLSWNNNASYLIDENEQKYFEFVANATASGSYTITITTLDLTGEYSSTLSLEVSGEICEQNWTCSNWSVCSDDSQTRTCTDLNSCGDDSEKPLESRYCSYSCIQDWICSDWSSCVGEIQTRTCTDLNSCGDDSEKPTETQSCLETCTPVYTCTDWQPETCKKEEIQTRTCTDSNSCGSNENKPTESRTCRAASKLLFTILIILIISLLIFDGVILMLKLKKENSIKNKQTTPRRYLYK